MTRGVLQGVTTCLKTVSQAGKALSGAASVPTFRRFWVTEWGVKLDKGLGPAHKVM